LFCSAIEEDELPNAEINEFKLFPISWTVLPFNLLIVSDGRLKLATDAADEIAFIVSSDRGSPAK
jgi:hypothetical protein